MSPKKQAKDREEVLSSNAVGTETPEVRSVEPERPDLAEDVPDWPQIQPKWKNEMGSLDKKIIFLRLKNTFAKDKKSHWEYLDMYNFGSSLC